MRLQSRVVHALLVLALLTLPGVDSSTQSIAYASALAATGGGGFVRQRMVSEPAGSFGEIGASIDDLGSTDHAVRSAAARRLRRAETNRAVAALLQAISGHRDGYVRFRALVLLTGFNDPRTVDVMRSLFGDPNDRLRSVAYGYFGYHPVASVVADLVEAAAREKAPFVRPALLRALAAHGKDDRALAIVLNEAENGADDISRGAAIEALGDYSLAGAVPLLTSLAQKPGPHQAVAVIALAQAGGPGVLSVLVSLQQGAPEDLQPRVAAGICLAGRNCAGHVGYLTEVIRFADRSASHRDLLRQAAASLGVLARSGNREAASVLLEAGQSTLEMVRAPVALAAGAFALRNPAFLLEVLAGRSDVEASIELLRESLDMLEEDLAKEQFYVALRRTHWEAAEGSATRALVQRLFEKLEF